MPTQLLTSRQAAERLGVSHIYVRRLVFEGKLKGRKVGQGYVLDVSAVDRFKAKRERELQHGSLLAAVRKNAPELVGALGALLDTWGRVRQDIGPEQRRPLDRAIKDLKAILS